MIGPPKDSLAPDRELNMDVAGFKQLCCVFRQGRGFATWHGRQQLFGVSMLGRIKQGAGFAGFYNLAVFHHTDGLRHFLNDLQIMGNQQKRHAQFILQVLEQFEDLRLNGDIKGRGRLIGNQEFRLVGKGHGDHHTLTLATGKFMRQGLKARRRVGNTDKFKQFKNTRTRLGTAQALVEQQHLADLLFDIVQRIKGCHRLLENHGNPVATDLAKLAFFGPDHFLPVKGN